MGEERTLGNILYNISEAKDNTQQQWICAFKERAIGHPEQKLLMKCLEAAESGAKYINWQKTAMPPESLEIEGFYIERSRTGLIYGWE